MKKERGEGRGKEGKGQEKEERKAGTKGWMEEPHRNSYATAQCWCGSNTIVTHRPLHPDCGYSSLFTFKVLLQELLTLRAVGCLTPHSSH